MSSNSEIRGQLGFDMLGPERAGRARDGDDAVRSTASQGRGDRQAGDTLVIAQAGTIGRRWDDLDEIP